MKTTCFSKKTKTQNKKLTQYSTENIKDPYFLNVIYLLNLVNIQKGFLSVFT